MTKRPRGLWHLSIILLFCAGVIVASQNQANEAPGTNAKKVWVIDAHRHLGNAGFLGNFPADQLIAEMDKLGVDKTLILPMGNVAKTREEDSRMNDIVNQANDDYFNKGIVSFEVRKLQGYRWDHTEVIAAIRKYPDRLSGVYMINPWLGKADLDEAERAIRQLGFCGLKLHPMANAFRADDEVVGPVMKLASRLGVPVMIHSCFGVGTEPWRGAKLAARFPDVNIILYHAGAHLTGSPRLVEGAIKAAQEHRNIFLELSDTQEDDMREILEQVPAEQIIYGTDAPWDKWSTRFAIVHRLTDSRPDVQQLVMGMNMARLLKLP